MLDRALKLIVTLTLLFFLLQVVIALLVRLVEAALMPMAVAVGTLGGIVSGLIALIALLCLTAGLLVRGRQFVVSRDPRARERAARERAGRTRVRRPAEDAPVHHREEPPPDPDPAINEADE
jgi:hypothetical protein